LSSLAFSIVRFSGMAHRALVQFATLSWL